MNDKISIRQVLQKEEWENLFSRVERRSFPQSWNWGSFQEKMGSRVWRIGVFDSDRLVGGAQIIEQKAKRGKFMIVPHGPVFLDWSEKYFSELVDYLKNWAQKEKSWFLRLAPFELDNEEKRENLTALGFRQAPTYVHAERTWNLQLDVPEEKLLAGMRKTTRQAVRKAQNQKISIEISANSEDIKLYKRLEKETVNRKHFTPYSLEFEDNLFQTFAPENQIAIFKGKWKGRLLSAAVVIFWQKRAFYYLGASSLAQPKIPVSHLVQWEAIREAKRRGCAIYNFWGIAPVDDPKHPWWGITVFKEGFGGYEERLCPTMDLVFNPRYWITWAVEKARRRRRRL